MVFTRFVDSRIWRVVRPDAVTVWYDEEVVKRLNWYYRVMRDEAPAKFLLAQRVECPSDDAAKIKSLDYEQLWVLHDELAREQYSRWREALRGELGVEEVLREKKPTCNYITVKVALLNRIIKRCILCERRCNIDRTKQIGVCRLDDKTYVHSWFHHLGEEAPLVPSGTIFYGGCNFRCVYCQNYDISQEQPREGVPVTPRQLALIQKELRLYGARNINHVGGEPTPSMHTIVASLEYLDVNVPQLWNSNMYLSLEAMKIIRDLIDIWLPDFKYGNNKCALRLSAVPRYFETVTRNLKIAVEHGDMIIRHLVLPGHVDCCTKKVLEWIASNLPKNRILVNIMDQYRPEYMVLKYPRRWPELTRRLRRSEIEEAYEYAKRLGILFEPVI